MDNQTNFYIILILSLILSRLPYIGIYFRVMNTMFHESGHVVMTLLTTGNKSRVELFSDTSGVATYVSQNKLSNFIISFAGYPGSSITAYLFFRLIKFEHYEHVLYIISFFVAINLIFFVRNKYGIFWLITIGIILGGLFYFQNAFINYWAAVFFSCIILTDSVASAFILLKLSIKNKNQAGDATNLKKFTHIPAFIWSLVFFVISIYFFYLSSVLYFPSLEKFVNLLISKI